MIDHPPGCDAAENTLAVVGGLLLKAPAGGLLNNLVIAAAMIATAPGNRGSMIDPLQSNRRPRGRLQSYGPAAVGRNRSSLNDDLQGCTRLGVLVVG